MPRWTPNLSEISLMPTGSATHETVQKVLTSRKRCANNLYMTTIQEARQQAIDHNALTRHHARVNTLDGEFVALCPECAVRPAKRFEEAAR